MGHMDYGGIIVFLRAKIKILTGDWGNSKKTISVAGWS